MQHPLRKPASKQPSAEAQAAAELKERVTQYSSRWDVQAVTKGTTDAAAPVQAAKALAALVAQLQQHRSACRRAEVRQHCAKQLSVALLQSLLTSSSRDAVSHTLQALLEYSRLLPGLLPVQLAGHILQLITDGGVQGVAAAKLLTEQLTHWRVSQLLPEWTLHDMTQQLYQQLQQQQSHTVATAGATSTAASSSSSSRVLEVCASYLGLLARLSVLAEQQIASDLAGNTDLARRWLQLVVTTCQQQQQNAVLNLVLLSRLMDSGCQLLAVMSKAAAPSVVLQQYGDLSLKQLEVLHQVLCRPCCVRESDEHTIQRWIHAAQAAALPVLWQPSTAAAAQGATSAVLSQDKLLTDIVLSAAATFSDVDPTSSSYSSSKLMQQLHSAALLLLAAAVKPDTSAYGSSKRPTSRFMSALLCSGNCRVLLHALAVAVETASTHNSAVIAGGLPGSRTTLEQHDSTGGLLLQVPAATAAAAAGHLSQAWLLLRSVSSQGEGVSSTTAAATGSNNSSGSSRSRKVAAAMDSREIYQVLRAYATFNSSNNQAQPTSTKLLSKLQLLLCQAALLVQQQVSSDAPSSSSSSSSSSRAGLGSKSKGTGSSNSNSSSRSSSDGEGSSNSYAEGSVVDKFVSTASSRSGVGGLQSLSWHWKKHDGHWASLAGLAADDHNGCGHARGWTWKMLASSFISLSVAVTVTGQQAAAAAAAAAAPGAAGGALMTAGEAGVVLSACNLAAAALKVLLPALLASSSSSSNMQGIDSTALAAADDRQQQQQKVKVSVRSERLEGVLECTLASLQALVMLSRFVKSQLPPILVSLTNTSSSSSSRHEVAAVKAAAAAVQQLQQGLDGQLQHSLSQVVSAFPAAPSNAASAGTVSCQSALTCLGQRCSGTDSCSSSSACVAAATVEGELLHQGHQEVRCWAAAALAICYGQLGSSSSSSEGAALQSARELEAEFTDAVLLLADGGQQQQQQQQHEVLIHAAVVAAGCPVLGQQLLSAAAAAAAAAADHAALATAAAAQSGRQLQVKLSSSVDATALHHALDYIYTGAAAVPQAGLVGQLAVCVAAVQDSIPANPNPWQQQQQQQRVEQQLFKLQEMQQAGQTGFLALGRLSKKLHLPLLAALCKQVLPLPGQQLQQLHPQLDGLLPDQVLVTSLQANQHQQQQQESFGAEVGELDCSLCQSNSKLQSPQHLGVCNCDTNSSSGSSLDPHSSCQSYLDHIQSFSMAAPQMCQIAIAQQEQPCAGSLGCDSPAAAGVCSVPLGAQFADVLLAAPAWIQPPCKETQQQQQLQYVAALLPGHRVLLSSRCQYFEALFSHRWGPTAAGANDHNQHSYLVDYDSAVVEVDQVQPDRLEQQQQQQPSRQLRVLAVPEADIHVAVALQHWLYTGQLVVQLPQDVVFVPQPTQQQQQQSKVHIQLSGCCQACHTARTLLRLWRCADLLLLPDLQAPCAAALTAAAWQQLACGCCLLLLSDCVELGVAAAMESVIAGLVERFDKDTATACQEWSSVPTALQDVLARGWMDNKRQQQFSSSSRGVDNAQMAVGDGFHRGASIIGGQYVHEQQQQQQQVHVVAVPLDAAHRVIGALQDFHALLPSCLAL